MPTKQTQQETYWVEVHRGLKKQGFNPVETVNEIYESITEEGASIIDYEGENGEEITVSYNGLHTVASLLSTGGRVF
jgi:hypothetical protein